MAYETDHQYIYTYMAYTHTHTHTHMSYEEDHQREGQKVNTNKVHTKKE
jgi:hypothetical protein